MNKPKKALIPVAGYGTRMFPITKTIQKEMLPVANRPIIDYVVQDCIDAGIEEIIFIIREGETQIQDYYSENKKLHSFLKKMGKESKYDIIKDIHTKAKFTFIEQKSDLYGTAVPLIIAKDILKNEDSFLVFMSDDFFYNPYGQGLAAQINNIIGEDVSAIATFVTREKSELSNYGVAKYREEDGSLYLEGLIEKPKPEEAPSNLTNTSKYLLTPEVFDIVAKQELHSSGELYITDTIMELVNRGKKVKIFVPQGEYLDCGSLDGWLYANNKIYSK